MEFEVQCRVRQGADRDNLKLYGEEWGPVVDGDGNVILWDSESQACEAAQAEYRFDHDVLHGFHPYEYRVVWRGVNEHGAVVSGERIVQPPSIKYTR